MEHIRCTTAEEVYRAIEAKDTPNIAGTFDLDLRTAWTFHILAGAPTIRIYGNESRGGWGPEISIFDSSSPTIEVFDSNKPLISAWNKSKPVIRAHDSSIPRITGWGNSDILVETYDLSLPDISAFDSSQIRIWTGGVNRPSGFSYGKYDPIYLGAAPHPSLKGPSVSCVPQTSLDVLLSGEL